MCRLWLFLPLVLATPGLVGCSSEPKLPKVSGKVIVDGQPAAGANLLFFTPGKRGGIVPSANAGPDGGFQIITNAKPGIAPGSYNVTVVWPDPSKKLSAAEESSGKGDIPDLLNGKYISPDSSALKAEITAATKELPPFDLKTK